MTRLTIAAPDGSFSGSRAGVVFRDGRGEVDASDTLALAYFARHGYAIDTAPSLTRKDLLARAAELDLDVSSRATATEIADAIAAATAPTEAEA